MLRLHGSSFPRAFNWRQQRGLYIDLRDPDHPVTFAIAATDQDAKSIRVEIETAASCPCCGRGKAGEK